MIWFVFILAIPWIIEAYLDRHGETKEGKRKDTLASLGVALVLVVAGYYFLGSEPLKVLALLLGWRVLIFDYLVTYLLIKNDVIVGKWWDYCGKTAKWDQVVCKVNWKVRLSIRVLLFVAALWWFLI